MPCIWISKKRLDLLRLILAIINKYIIFWILLKNSRVITSYKIKFCLRYFLFAVILYIEYQFPSKSSTWYCHIYKTVLWMLLYFCIYNIFVNYFNICIYYFDFYRSCAKSISNDTLNTDRYQFSIQWLDLSINKIWMRRYAKISQHCSLSSLVKETWYRCVNKKVKMATNEPVRCSLQHSAWCQTAPIQNAREMSTRIVLTLRSHNFPSREEILWETWFYTN